MVEQAAANVAAIAIKRGRCIIFIFVFMVSALLSVRDCALGWYDSHAQLNLRLRDRRCGGARRDSRAKCAGAQTPPSDAPTVVSCCKEIPWATRKPPRRSPTDCSTGFRPAIART